MPEKATWINLKVSKLALLWMLICGLLLILVLWWQPWAEARWLIVLLLLHLGWALYGQLGPVAPCAFCWREQRLDIINRQGEVFSLTSAPCWISPFWIAWRLPWAPYSCWLLWPDAVTPAERAALRRWVYAQRDAHPSS
ncbi:hypothetical protein [Marinospirillum sp.]|uniref:hypothetical protein n=1 Tax=Marinospirillum sp. TaxID=2183934 RepID=UPI003A8C38B0